MGGAVPSGNRLRLDLNSPEFQDVFFRLPVAELKQVAASLARLRELDWNSLYRHTGYNWDGEFRARSTLARVTRTVLMWSVAALADVAGTAAALWPRSGGLPASAGGPPNVLLVTLDTTRADRLGACGYAAARTPVLDRLARDGVLFERVVAAASAPG